MKYGSNSHYPGNKFILALPKVPSKTWWQMVAFFKIYARKGLEAAAFLLYDKVKMQYEIFIPNQRIAPYVVEYETGDVYDKLDENENLVWVADFHSHHQMQPFYSRTDDANERGTRLYGVFGNYNPNTLTYDILLRAGCQGLYTSLDAGELLDEYEVRTEWAAKIQPRYVPGEWIEKTDYRLSSQMN